MIIDKINKLTLPATILIASLILGGGFYASQVNKQRSIERQQQIKIETEKQEQLVKELKEQQAKKEAEENLNKCLKKAEEFHSNCMRSMCDTDTFEIGTHCSMSGIEHCGKEREKDKAECFKRYPQK